MNVNSILYFVKYPSPGRVKTRLAKTIGDQQAAELYRQLAFENFSVLMACPNADVIVVYDPPEKLSEICHWLNEARDYTPQTGSDLGERLRQAFQWSFDRGYKRVTVYGSDTLDLSVEIVEQGFMVLDDADVVIGPAQDGGYYMIGTSAIYPKLFEGIPWSTPEVLKETLKTINTLGIQCRQLPTLEDLDEIKSGVTYEFIDGKFEKRRS